MEAGFQSGCNDYITKPVNGAELVALVQSYLGRVVRGQDILHLQTSISKDTS